MQCSNPAHGAPADPYKQAEEVADRLTIVFVWVGIAVGLSILGGWGYIAIHFIVKFS